MRPLITATLLATLALGATSCGNDDPPVAADPAPSNTAPPPTRPTPTAEPTPQPWEKHTKAGAVAFAKHWIDEFNRSRSTGSTAELKRLSDGQCTTCNRFITLTHRIYAAGGAVRTEGWHAIAVAPAPVSPAGTQELSVRVHEAKSTVVRAAEATTERYQGGVALFTFRLVWSGTSWTTREIELVA